MSFKRLGSLVSKVKVSEVRPTLRVEEAEKEEGSERMRCQGVPEKGAVCALPLPKTPDSECVRTPRGTHLMCLKVWEPTLSPKPWAACWILDTASMVLWADLGVPQKFIFGNPDPWHLRICLYL